MDVAAVTVTAANSAAVAIYSISVIIFASYVVHACIKLKREDVIISTRNMFFISSLVTFACSLRLVDSVVQMVLGWLRISSSRTGIIVDTISTCLGIVAHYSWLPIMVAYTTGIVIRHSIDIRVFRPLVGLYFRITTWISAVGFLLCLVGELAMTIVSAFYALNGKTPVFGTIVFSVIFGVETLLILLSFIFNVFLFINAMINSKQYAVETWQDLGDRAILARLVVIRCAIVFALLYAFYLSGLFGSGIAQVFLTENHDFFVLQNGLTRSVTQNVGLSLLCLLLIILFHPWVNALTERLKVDLDLGFSGKNNDL